MTQKILSVIFSGIALLAIQNKAVANPEIHPWLGLEGGISETISASSINSILLPDTNEAYDYYVTSIKSNTQSFGLSGGYEFSNIFSGMNNRWFPSYRVGLAYDYYAPQKLSGVIDLYNSNLEGYTYQMKTHSNTLWLENQVDLVHVKNFTPFLELGVGAAWNTTKDYSETPVSSNVDPREQSAALLNHTNRAFAYRTGIGLNYQPKASGLNIGLLYRYTDRGVAKTGASPNYAEITSLNSPRLRSNDVLLTFRYNLK